MCLLIIPHPVVKLVKDYRNPMQTGRPGFRSLSKQDYSQFTLHFLLLLTALVSFFAGLWGTHIWAPPSLSLYLWDTNNRFLNYFYGLRCHLYTDDFKVCSSRQDHLLDSRFIYPIAQLISTYLSTDSWIKKFKSRHLLFFFFSLMNFSILVNGNSILIVGQTPNHGVIIDFPLSLICHT